MLSIRKKKTLARRGLLGSLPDRFLSFLGGYWAVLSCFSYIPFVIYHTPEKDGLRPNNSFGQPTEHGQSPDTNLFGRSNRPLRLFSGSSFLPGFSTTSCPIGTLHRLGQVIYISGIGYRSAASAKTPRQYLSFR